MLAFLGLTLPPAVWLLWQEEAKHQQLGVVALCFVVFLMMSGKRQFLRFSDSVGIRYENNQLIDGLKLEIAKHQQTALKLKAAKQAAEQANEAKSEFLSVMSHELRTPIHGIMGTLELLMDTPLEKDQEEAVVMARQASLSLSLIVNDVLDLAKLNAGKMEVHQHPFSLTKFMDGIMQHVQMRAKEKQLNLAYHIRDVPSHLIHDELHLRQVMLNLLGNAVKFTEKGRVDVWVSRLNEMLIMEIVDTGIGIAASELPTIFDPFKQVKDNMASGREGTGLGTSIAKRFVELLGGRIDVQSVLGEGSRFTVQVPCGWQGEAMSCDMDIFLTHLRDVPR